MPDPHVISLAHSAALLGVASKLEAYTKIGTPEQKALARECLEFIQEIRHDLLGEVEPLTNHHF